MSQHFLDLQLVGQHQYCATLLHAHDTDTRATMNMAVGDGVIAAGQDGTCSVMKFKRCSQKEGRKAAAKEGKCETTTSRLPHVFPVCECVTGDVRQISVTCLF